MRKVVSHAAVEKRLRNLAAKSTDTITAAPKSRRSVKGPHGYGRLLPADKALLQKAMSLIDEDRAGGVALNDGDEKTLTRILSRSLKGEELDRAIDLLMPPDISRASVELADDETQKRVIINQQTLIKAEKLVKLAGLPEDQLTPSIHHFVVGAAAYLLVNSIDPKTPQEIRKFLQRYKTLIKRLRFEVPGADDEGSTS